MFEMDALQTGLVQAFKVVKSVAVQIDETEGCAIQSNGKALTAIQHFEVNRAIESDFKSGAARLLSGEELWAIDPSNILKSWGVSVYLVPSLANADSYLLAHPGNGGEALNHQGMQLYLSPGRLETLRQLSAPAKAQFANHEAAHLNDPEASEEEIQSQYPIDMVLLEVEALAGRKTSSWDATSAAPAERRRAILRKMLMHLSELNPSTLPDEFLDALALGGDYMPFSWVSIVAKHTLGKQIPELLDEQIRRAFWGSTSALWPLDIPVVSPGSPDYKEFAFKEIANALQRKGNIEIEHPKFGRGLVLNMSQTKAEIRFADPIGVRKLDLTIAPFTLAAGDFTQKQRQEKAQDLRYWLQNMRDDLERQWTLGGHIADYDQVKRWRTSLGSATFNQMAIRLEKLWKDHSFDLSDPKDLSQFHSLAERFATAAAADPSTLWKIQDDENTVLQQDARRIKKLELARFKEEWSDAAHNLGDDFISRHWNTLFRFESAHSDRVGSGSGTRTESNRAAYIILTNVLPSVRPAALEKDLDGFLYAMVVLLQDYSDNYKYGGDPEDIESVEGFASQLLAAFSVEEITQHSDSINELLEKMTAIHDNVPPNGAWYFFEMIKQIRLFTKDLGLILPILASLVDLEGFSPEEMVAIAAVVAQQPEVNRATVIERVISLKNANFLPLPNLILSPVSVNELRTELKAIQQGHFAINNPIHLDLNYNQLRNEIIAQRPLTERESYPEFLKFADQIRRGKYMVGDYSVDPAHKVQIRGLVYEAHQVRKKILSLQNRARELGRPLIVIENLSYGAVATSPITVDRQGGKFIVGTDIPVWSTKIGSSESHNNEFVMREDLFSPTQMQFLLTNQPIVVVVDGSTSVADPARTSPHIPDGFKGYRNQFMAVNAMLGVTTRPAEFVVDDGFLEAIQKRAEFKRLTSHYKLENPADTQPYSLHFYYPGERALYLRAGKKIDELAPKLQDDSSLNGPAVVFIESAMEDEAIPNAIRSGYIGGKHTAAFFDDQAHYKQFYLDYEEGYGIHLSASYMLRSRSEYGELVKFLGEHEAEQLEPTPLEQNRLVDTIVLDLDGTLVPTDQPLNARVVAILQNLLVAGKKVVITTEDIEPNVDRRAEGLVKRLYNIDPDLLKGLWLATDGGTTLYRFVSPDRKSRATTYESGSNLGPEVRGRILTELSHSLSGIYKMDERPERASTRRVDLRDVPNRDQFIDRVRNLPLAINLGLTVYKAGRTSVKIALRHKEDAIRYLVQTNNLDESRMLIIGDSARTNQIDRGMLSEFRQSVAINVGKASRSIGRINPQIIQMEAGIDGAIRTLESLAQNGRLPMRPLLPYRAVYQKSSLDNGDYESDRKENALVLNSFSAYQIEQLLGRHPMLESAVSFVVGFVMVWGALATVGLHSAPVMIVSSFTIGYLAFHRWVIIPQFLLKTGSTIIPFMRNVLIAA